MADALCGPSNALQSFQKHTQVDRTLQQDRLVGQRHTAGQSFRSFDPRAGSLDGEFHAFENASPHPFQLEQPQPQWSGSAMPVHAPAQMPGWASDFQNLRITNSPVPVSQFRTEAPLVRSAPGGWQQEFMRMRESASASPKVLGKQPMAASPLYQQEQMQYGNNFAQQSFSMPQMGMQQQEGNTQMLNSQAQFSDAAFEHAFQSAFEQMQQLDNETLLAETSTDTAKSTLLHETNQGDIREVSSARIGSDAIQYVEQQDRTVDHDQRDASELARVAGELIQNVSHETDEKFRNSTFLDLMRRIRDREVEVRNNDFEHIQEQRTPNMQPLQKVPDVQDFREHDPNSFEFPDMNQVYQPNEAVDMTPDDYEPLQPRTQIQDLHPGGPRYPEISGAIRDANSNNNAGYAAA